METAIIIIGAVIQLITLIVFFVLASNVSKIKKNLLHMDNMGYKYFEMAKEEKYVGNKDKAKDYLLRAKYQYEVGSDGGLYPWGNQWRDRSDIVAEIDSQLSEL